MDMPELRARFGFEELVIRTELGVLSLTARRGPRYVTRRVLPVALEEAVDPRSVVDATLELIARELDL
jgi:hypothetical protein